MKANNLTISVPAPLCTKCPYCVSKMTMAVDDNRHLFFENLPKVLSLAKRMGVTHALITSKNEPMDAWKTTYPVILHASNAPFITELQTKPISRDDFDRLELKLDRNYLDILAISVDDLSVIQYITRDLFPFIRLTLNLTNKLANQLNEYDSIASFIDIMSGIYGIKQVTFRQLTIPDNPVDTDDSRKVIKYITDNHNDKYHEIMEELKVYPIDRRLNFGAVIRNVNGVGVVCMEYCIQESNDNETIRSLIYHADGGLYTHWNSTASRIL